MPHEANTEETSRVRWCVRNEIGLEEKKTCTLMLGVFLRVTLPLQSLPFGHVGIISIFQFLRHNFPIGSVLRALRVREWASGASVLRVTLLRHAGLFVLAERGGEVGEG